MERKTLMERKAFIVRVPIALHRAVRIKSVQTDKAVNEYLAEKLADWVREPMPAVEAESKKAKAK